MARIKLPLSGSLDKSLEALTKALRSYLTKRFENLKPAVSAVSNKEKYITIQLTLGVGFNKTSYPVCFVAKQSFGNKFREGDNS